MEQIGHTDVVSEEEEVGEIEERVECGYVEWQEGVLRADRPAERAMWRRGTEGRERSVLWVWVKSSARELQRERLYNSWEKVSISNENGMCCESCIGKHTAYASALVPGGKASNPHACCTSLG